MNETVSKLLALVVLCVYVLAAIGGTAYLFFYGLPLFGVTSLALAVMAFPVAKKAWKTLTA